MEQEFDVLKWRAENPMDYIKAMDIINLSSNKYIRDIKYLLSRYSYRWLRN